MYDTSELMEDNNVLLLFDVPSPNSFNADTNVVLLFNVL